MQLYTFVQKTKNYLLQPIIVQNNDLLRGHESGFQQISSGKFEEGFLTIEKCYPGMGHSWCLQSDKGASNSQLLIELR